MVKRWLRKAIVLFLPLFLGIASAHAAPGDFLASFGADRLNYPLNGVGLDATGKIYVNDYGNGDLKTFDPSFNFLESWDATHPDREYPQYSLFLNPHSLAVHGNRVYVAVPAFGAIKAYTLAGEFLYDIAFSYPPEIMCSWSPSALATDAEGNLYATDLATDSTYVTDPATGYAYKHYCGRQVLVFSPDGQYQRTIGSPGSDPDRYPGSEPDTLGYPEGVAVDAQGQVYVTDAHRVVIYARSGAWLRTFNVEMSPGQWGPSMAPAVDRDGRIYVTDAFNHRIQVFTNYGALLATWGGPGFEAGQFNMPMGATLDPAGNRLFVTDMWNHRIQVLEAFPVKSDDDDDECGYSFKDFLPPVSLNKPFKAGSAIPVKFGITSDCDARVDASAFTVKLWKNDKKVKGTTVRPGAAAGTYHFNLNTKGLAAGAYTLVVKFPDGSQQTKTITLKN